MRILSIGLETPTVQSVGYYPRRLSLSIREISCVKALAATKEDTQPSLSERAAETIMAAIFGLHLNRIQIVRRENVEMA
jgi:hypothetical protein